MLSAVPERFSIAQVTPYPWEMHHEVNRYVERLSDELCRRGHRVAVVAPSDSRPLIREGRERVRAAASDPEAIFADEGCASLVGVGQSLPFRRGGSVSLPLDVSRTSSRCWTRRSSTSCMCTSRSRPAPPAPHCATPGP